MQIDEFFRRVISLTRCYGKQRVFLRLVFAVHKFCEIIHFVQIDDFTQAVLAACQAARPGDVVILSPACASFDRFKNFMERGAAFKKIIYELPGAEGE